MYTKKVLITNPSGLHARPATKLCDICQTFDCDLTMMFNNMPIESKSVLSILSAGISPGSLVEVIGQGSDEKTAVDTVVKFIEELND